MLKSSSQILKQRSRQLKKTQPLQVVFHEIAEDEVINACPDVQGLVGMDKKEKGEEHIKHAVQSFSATDRAFQAVPVPESFSVLDKEEEEDEGDWRMPEGLIEHDEPVAEMYDVEEDDANFIATFSKDSQLDAEVFEKIVDKLERLTGYQPDFCNVVAVAKAREELPDVRAELVDAVYGYWKMKRYRLGKALYREYVTLPSWSDPNPFLTFRPRLDTPLARRQKLRQDQKNFKEAQKIRNQMQSALAVVALLQRRERLKKELLELDCGFVELDLEYALLSQKEREEIEERLKRGILAPRVEVDRQGEIARYRRVFEDPSSLPGYVERERHDRWEVLDTIRTVRLPGKAPFLAVISKVGKETVMKKLSMSDILRLKSRLLHRGHEDWNCRNEYGKRDRVKDRFHRIQQLILTLRKMSTRYKTNDLSYLMQDDDDNDDDDDDDDDDDGQDNTRDEDDEDEEEYELLRFFAELEHDERFWNTFETHDSAADLMDISEKRRKTIVPPNFSLY